jgi:hypothetical protein
MICNIAHSNAFPVQLLHNIRKKKHFQNNWPHLERDVKIGSLLVSIAHLYTKSQNCSKTQR